MVPIKGPAVPVPDAGAKLERAKKIMKAQYDKHRRAPMEYQLGDMVWLSAAHSPPTGPPRSWTTGTWGLTRWSGGRVPLPIN